MAPLRLVDRLRKDNCIDELIKAAQDGRLTWNEYRAARRLLHITDWRIENITGLPVALVERIRAVCPSLTSTSEPATADQPAKINTTEAKTTDPNEGFGLQPQT